MQFGYRERSQRPRTLQEDGYSKSERRSWPWIAKCLFEAEKQPRLPIRSRGLKTVIAAPLRMLHESSAPSDCPIEQHSSPHSLHVQLASCTGREEAPRRICRRESRKTRGKAAVAIQGQRRVRTTKFGAYTLFIDALMHGFSIFVPADSNPLLDILLARGVNGESPKKSPGLRGRQCGSTNVKGKGKATADQSNRSEQVGTQSKHKGSRGRANSKAAEPETSKKVAKGRKSKNQKPVDGEENDQPVAGAPYINPHIRQC